VPPPGARPPAFVNDLETCVGCHACVVACANENELAPGTSWRHVVSHNASRAGGAAVFHLSLACNHCLDAPCLRGCPARAIRRDASTGAVLIHQDDCIGCRYCSWVCPYDAPRFDPGDGVMRKCTFCAHRLAEGLAPACVAACPVDALGLGVPGAVAGAIDGRPAGFPHLGIRPSIAFLPTRARALSPGAIASRSWPEASATWAEGGQQPVTASEPLGPSMLPVPATADTGPRVTLRTEWSLAVFTSVAIVLAGGVGGWVGGGPHVPAWLVLALGAAGVALSTAHLGRPLRAWRAALNWRTSWLSREVISYSAFLGLAAAASLWGERTGPLALAAAAAALACLVSIDHVYAAMARHDRVRADDTAALASGMFIAGLLSSHWGLWLPAALQRAIALVARLRRREPPRGLRLALDEGGPRLESAAAAGGSDAAFGEHVTPDPRAPRRRTLLLLRVLAGWLAPLALWWLGPPTLWPLLVALAIAGEVLDRLAFYDTLDIITPRSQMARDQRTAA
jgi:Fe-S-cluster-containing dehydrogenase component